MNTNILQPEIQQFIKANNNVSVSKIALSQSPFAGVTAAELAQQIDGKQRLAKKIPQWVNTEGIYYPQRQSLEQCSSFSTANYKSNLITGTKVLDMTGGMGVDTWAKAQKTTQMVYCEQNKELCDITQHNFSVLGAKNIKVFNGDALLFLQQNKEQFDTIYIDPARRDTYNRKMVSFTDCQPDVVTNRELLWQYTSRILIKASPMLDINRAIGELQNVKEVHVVAVKNECKELLFLLEKEFTETAQFFAINLETENQVCFSFTAEAENEANACIALPQQYIYEPNTAILKSGAFQLPAVRYGMKKLHRFTHLYTSEQLIPDFPGNIYEIQHVCDYNKKQIKQLLPERKANVKCYNFVDKPAVVQKRLQLKDGGIQFLFCVKNKEEKYQLLLCKKIDY